MALYRYRITPQSAFATPMRSDTLYGHLLWAAAMLDGEGKVREFIDAFAGESPPFVLSSALPSGQLPRPALPGIPRARFDAQFGGKGALFEALQRYKVFRKQGTWAVESWGRLHGQLSQEALFADWLAQRPAAPKVKTGQVRPNETVIAHQPHVTIDRQSGSVLEQGGLFFSQATWYRPGTVLDLYVRTEAVAEFERLFDHLAATGFGADRSTGKGQFRYERDPAFDARPFEGQGSHRLSLSVCTATDLPGFTGYWMSMVKHGRAWSGFGERNPFKKPFFAFSEGSVFRSMPASGYLLRHIHSDPRIVQVGWPLTIPVTLEGQDEH